MQLYGGLKVNMLQYMFVYNTPCLGQQVKGHNASEATQIMGSCGWIICSGFKNEALNQEIR